MGQRIKEIRSCIIEVINENPPSENRRRRTLKGDSLVARSLKWQCEDTGVKMVK